MNKFSERYKTISNSDLLRVIENKSDYQSEAVEAAKTEINQRNLSDNEMTEAKNELEIELQERIIKNEKRANAEQKVKTFGILFFDLINPIQKSAPTPEKLIKLIAIVFGLIVVVNWYNEFGFVKFMLTVETCRWDLSVCECFLPLIILPVAVILFGFKKKSGWILMAAYLTYSAISAFGLIIKTWNKEPTGIPSLDSLFPQISTTTQILTTLFFAATLWVLTKKEIMQYYNINRQAMIITIGIAAALTVLFIGLFLLT